jgi:hypothetical protein
MVFRNYQVVSGAGSGDSTLSVKDARAALPKGLVTLKWFGAHQLLPVGKEVEGLGLPVSEGAFKKFLAASIGALVEGKEVDVPEPSEGEKALAGLVPLSAFNVRPSGSRLAVDQDTERREVFWKVIGAAALKTVAGGAAALSARELESLVRGWLAGGKGRSEGKMEDDEASREALSAGLAGWARTDEEMGAAFEEQQERLGPARLPKEGGG